MDTIFKLPTAAWVRIRLLVRAVHLCSWPRTAHVTLHLVHALQREKIAIFRVALVFIDDFEYTMYLQFLISLIVEQLLVNPRTVDSTCPIQALWLKACCARFACLHDLVLV